MSSSPAMVLGASPVTPESMIARLQGDAGADPRLAAIPAATRDQTIERAVRQLWATSRVKTFLPVLALRQAQEALADLAAPRAANAPDSANGAGDAAPRSGGGTGDDAFLLAPDDVLDLSDDVM